MSQQFQLGRTISEYMSGRAQTCTLVVTEQCNLRCKYCYQVGKNSNHPMPREIAFKAIDFFLGLANPSDGVILEFTGGEPTLEIDLLNDIVEYFKSTLYEKAYHPWQSAYVIMISTNGTLYHTEKVQRFLWENREHSYPALTIDGTKQKHDSARIFPDGSGSYDIVAENVKLWTKQYPNATTKITFGKEDIPYVAESILHVWSLGVKSIAANPVFERVWEPEDAQLYESELHKLADAAINEGFWRTHKCNLFWIPRDITSQKDDDRNWCGTGKMMSVDAEGNLYPCIRFQGFCLENRKGRSIGNIFDGLNENLLRSFHCLRKSLQSTKECLECPMRDQCSWCSAHNYDAADSDTVFQRATFICEMHKARWRANQYYWQQLEKKFGVKPVKNNTSQIVIDCQR